MIGGPGAYLIGEEEKREVMEVLQSGHLFRYGSFDDPRFLHKTYTFEQEFAAYCGVKRAGHQFRHLCDCELPDCPGAQAGG